MMNKDKCQSISFDKIVDILFNKMDNRLKFVWLLFTAGVICMLIYIIFNPSPIVFTVIVLGFFVSIVNIMGDIMGNIMSIEERYYFNIFFKVIIVILIIYIIFDPMIKVFFINAPSSIYKNSVYIWITILYIYVCFSLARKCIKDGSGDFCRGYYITWIFIGVTIIYFFIFMLYNLLTTISKEGMTDVTTILPIPSTPSEFNYSLASYYVMTASDCCLDPSNKTVSIDALKNAIGKGARCLDFQLFSVNNTPVVSYSSSKDNFYFINVTNTIPFSDVMKTIATYAFQEATCSNFSDPLIIHLRVKSNNEDMFAALTNILSSYVNYMLSSQYNYTSIDPINIPGMSLPFLKNKIIIIIDNTYPSVLKYKPINEYVNIISNVSFCQTMQYTDYKNTPDITQLINFNKTALSIVLPDDNGSINPQPLNISLSETNPGGVQMTGISFQYNNAKDISLFTESKYAFILKPEILRSSPPPTYNSTEQPIDPIPKTTSVQGGLKITL